MSTFYKFYPIKQIYSSEKNLYLAQALTIQVKNSYTLASLYVLNKWLKIS